MYHLNALLEYFKHHNRSSCIIKLIFLYIHKGIIRVVTTIWKYCTYVKMYVICNMKLMSRYTRNAWDSMTGIYTVMSLHLCKLYLTVWGLNLVNTWMAFDVLLIKAHDTYKQEDRLHCWSHIVGLAKAGPNYSCCFLTICESSIAVKAGNNHLLPLNTSTQAYICSGLCTVCCNSVLTLPQCQTAVQLIAVSVTDELVTTSWSSCVHCWTATWLGTFHGTQVASWNAQLNNKGIKITDLLQNELVYVSNG